MPIIFQHMFIKNWSVRNDAPIGTEHHCNIEQQGGTNLQINNFSIE